jgi:hypothetical protein
VRFRQRSVVVSQTIGEITVGLRRVSLVLSISACSSAHAQLTAYCWCCSRRELGGAILAALSCFAGEITVDLCRVSIPLYFYLPLCTRTADCLLLVLYEVRAWRCGSGSARLLFRRQLVKSLLPCVASLFLSISACSSAHAQLTAYCWCCSRRERGGAILAALGSCFADNW